MPTKFRIDAAVAATILGIIVSTTIWYLDREQKEIDQVNAATTQRQQQEMDSGRFKQDLVLELQSMLLQSKSVEDLQKLERSLTLLERNGNSDTADIISVFRKQIVAELRSADLQGRDKEVFNIALQSMQSKVSKYENRLSDKQAKDRKAIQALATFSEKSGGSTRLKLKSITCLDPQSNWPKRCDDIYFELDGLRLWKAPRSLCRGEKLMLEDQIPFSNESVLSLMEYDRTDDDLLGQMTISKQVALSKNMWTIKQRDGSKGEWHYQIEYEVSN